MKHRKIVFLRYPRTTLYIGVCLLAFFTLVSLVYLTWPKYFTGGEPLSEEVLYPPIIDRIEAERQAFLLKYCAFCAGAAIFAFGFYITFNLVCLHNYASFCENRYKWRRAHLLSYAALLFSIWNRFFGLPNSWRTLVDWGLAALTILWLLSWPIRSIAAYIARHWKTKAQESPSLDSVMSILSIIDIIFSILAVMLNLDVYQMLWKLLRGISTLPSAIFAVDVSTTYRLSIVPQWLMAAVPLLPLLMLIMWSTLCMPKLLGNRPNAPTPSSFICLDKHVK